MRISFTILLAVITLLLCALVVVFTGEEYRHLLFGKPSVQPGEKLFDVKDLDEVRQITLTNSQGDLAHFRVDGNRWMATKPWQDRADPLYMKALMHFTALLQVEEVIERDEVALEECGLEDGHIKVVMENKDGKKVCQYLIGRQTAWHIPSNGEDNKLEDNKLIPSIFIQIPDDAQDNNIYVCSQESANAIHRLFENKFERFRDHHPFYFSPKYLDNVRIQNAQGEVVLSRQNLKSAWTISKPLELRADPNSLNALFANLGQLTALKVEDRENVTLASGEDTTAQTRELSIHFAGKEDEITLHIYPPAEDNNNTALATVSDRPDAVFELPLTSEASSPNTTSLSQLESGVNDLRAKTMTHLNGPQLKTIIIRPEAKTPIMLQRTPKTTWRVLSRTGWKEANQDAVIDLMTAITRDKIQKFVTDAATDLSPYGLDQPFLQIAFISFKNESMRVAFGRDTEKKNLYAHIVGKPNIWQIGAETFAKIAQNTWQWRTSHVWHIPKIDITKISIQRIGQPDSELSYDHFTGTWTAIQNGKSASAKLNPNRADKFLGYLDSMTTQRWLGPLHAQAMLSLANPDITVKLSLRRFDNEGNDLPPMTKTLRVTQTPGGYINFGKIDSFPIGPDQEDETSYFLLTPETLKKLNVNLFE
ncbi:MAG: DUF4340 domain-containing protein [Akkermansiaceae bacterium]|nr:DUF4340 domain-containing protein [Akkermansiaceae bacterium]